MLDYFSSRPLLGASLLVLTFITPTAPLLSSCAAYCPLGDEAAGGGSHTTSGAGEAPAALEAPPAQALRARFPAQADAVLRQAEAFLATPEGFAIQTTARAAAGRALDVTLPREGRDPLRVRDRRGFEVRVRELGVEDSGSLSERAVSYRRAGGTSFWTATADSAEEWLHLEAGAARAGEPVAAWDVEGATVRAHDGCAELVDESGTVRLRVTAPSAYAAGGRAIHAWMAGQAGRLELWVEPQEHEVLVDPLWTSAASMYFPRERHTATLLPNGKVLIAGGSLTTARTELYGPATDTWSFTDPMASDRKSHTATLLPNGNVLVAGGFDDIGSTLAKAELYDPAKNLWKPAASLANNRMEHTATLLPSGKVLVVGGDHGFIPRVPVFTAELYDPTTDTWSSAAAPITAHAIHTATLLPSGKVLVAGGLGISGGTTSAELYDPATNAWTPTASLNIGRLGHTATLLPSGKVLVAGGANGSSSINSAELYDPATSTWTPSAAIVGRIYHTATLLPSGQVLLVGGGGSASVDLYDPVADTLKPTISLSVARASQSATLLPNGQVLVAGGMTDGGTTLASAELYTPCASTADCQILATRECQVGVCDLPTEACVASPKQDGTPCSVGSCSAGSCVPEGMSSSSSSSTSTTATSSGASGGGGADPSTSSSGSTSTSSGGADPSTSSSGSTSTGAAPSATTAGAGGGTSTASGGGEGGASVGGSGSGGGNGSGCEGGCTFAPGSAVQGAPWMLAGLLLLRRRQRRQRSQAS